MNKMCVVCMTTDLHDHARGRASRASSPSMLRPSMPISSMSSYSYANNSSTPCDASFDNQLYCSRAKTQAIISYPCSYSLSATSCQATSTSLMNILGNSGAHHLTISQNLAQWDSPASTFLTVQVVQRRGELSSGKGHPQKMTPEH